MSIPDPYLEAMMHGDFLPKEKADVKVKKNKFDLAIERQINDYIDTLNLEADPFQNKLISPSVRRSKILFELKNAISLPDLESYLPNAISLLISKGQHYLEHEAYTQMELELSKIPEMAERVDLSNEIGDSFQSVFKIDDTVMQSILQIAIAKFREEKYEESFSLFVLLSSLSPGNFDYWLQLGVAAQKFQKLDLALRAYEMALDLNPDLIGAKLFMVECYIEKNLLQQATKALEEAKQMADRIQMEQVWSDLLQALLELKL